MLLYLTSNQKTALIDAAVREKELTAKKLAGKFSLKSFVTKDMRNYTAAKTFVVDAACAEETAGDFCVALQSFQMMFSARIIVILSGCENGEDYISRLISSGVTNIVTADTPEGVTEELLECLSEGGMQRYLTQYAFAEQEQAVETTEQPESEVIRKYKWNAKNIKIAVAGSQRRSGVTVTAFNLAAWLTARGAEVCYVEMNTNRHLQIILNIYDAQKDGEHYTVDGIDCYLTNELDRDYEFIVYDCGVLNTPASCFRNADVRLLCGSVLPYELSELHRALAACEGMKVNTAALCVPEEMKDYCRELFGEDIAFAGASHDLFASNANGQLYRPLVQGYIAGEK